MNETPNTSAPDAGTWIGRLLIAVILGEGIWGLIVSVTNNLVLPFMARNMGGDLQSPLYLGKGDFNVPALFTSVLELCFAGIVAVILNSWLQRRRRPARTKSARVSPIPAHPAITVPSIPAVMPVQTAALASPSAAGLTPGQFWAPPESSSRPPVAAPAKAKPPREVIYNSVGDPINPTEGG